MPSKLFPHQLARPVQCLRSWMGLGICIFGLASCGTQPVARTEGHLQQGSSSTPAALGRQTGAIPTQVNTVPDPVRQVPLPPPPRPRVDELKYSVTVNNVPVQELMFAIGRDTKVNIDIHPDIKGRITLNAIDQTL